MLKDSCKRGHPFTDDSTIWQNSVKSQKVRMCRTCCNMRKILYNHGECVKDGGMAEVIVKYRCNKCQNLQDGDYPAMVPRPDCTKCGEKVVIVKFVRAAKSNPRLPASPHAHL